MAFTAAWAYQNVVCTGTIENGVCQIQPMPGARREVAGRVGVAASRPSQKLGAQPQHMSITKLTKLPSRPDERGRKSVRL